VSDIKEGKVREMMKLSTDGRTTLAKAILEDEAVRRASQVTSKIYLESCEDEKDSMPFWMWCALYFCLGMLFTMTIPALGNLLWNFTQGNII